MEMVLTHYPVPVIPRRMGRPPLGVKSTNVRLSEDDRERIRDLVGDSGMASFIREAIAEKLRREERKKARSKQR